MTERQLQAMNLAYAVIRRMISPGEGYAAMVRLYRDLRSGRETRQARQGGAVNSPVRPDLFSSAVPPSARGRVDPPSPAPLVIIGQGAYARRIYGRSENGRVHFTTDGSGPAAGGGAEAPDGPVPGLGR